MALSGRARKTVPAVPTSTASRHGHVRSSSPPATSARPPGFRIGGGIRVVRSADGSKTSSQEHAASSEAGPTPLYRRILYPGLNDNPPRILATLGTEKVDVHLYTLLALICRGFIAPWYSKISRDRAFFLEVVRVTSHVFRQLEFRLVNNDGLEGNVDAHLNTKKIDKIRFIFDTLPRILERHIQDFRTASSRSKSAYSAGVHRHNGLSNLEVYFHSIQSHAAINLSPPCETSPDERLPPAIDADYLRAVIDALLEQLLPKEDFIAETERSVVREVIVGIVLDGIFRKVAQPWFIYGLVTKQLDRRTADSKDDVYQAANNSKPVSGVSSDSHLDAPREWWLNLAAYMARLPLFFSQMVALFGYLSWLFTTSFASPYYKSYTRSPGHVSNITYAWSSLAMTALRSEGPGRHTISQLGRTAQNIASAGSALLDRCVCDWLILSHLAFEETNLRQRHQSPGTLPLLPHIHSVVCL